MKKLGCTAAVGCLLSAVHLCGQGAFGAGISSPASLSELTGNADLIVVGAGGPGVQSGSILTFPLQVSRVIKGNSAIAGTTINVDWATAPPAHAAGMQRSGVWFLKSSSSGWLLLPVTKGLALADRVSFPAPSGPILSAYAYQPTASFADKLAAELASAIEGANGGSNDTNLRDLQALGLLDQLNSSMVPLLYGRMAASTAAQEAILGISGLIRQGQGAALSSAAGLGPLLAAYPRESAVLLLNIRGLFRATDAQSVTALGQAAVDTTNPSVPLREACAEALRSIHTKEALPYLATLLDDPDVNLQSAGVGGLSAFANGLPVQTLAAVPSLSYLQRPASAPYQTQDTIANGAMGPQAYRKAPFWKSWWAANRAALGY